MQLQDKTLIVTGAASGIGRALALRFARERPRGLVLADLPAQAAALQSLAQSRSEGQAGVGAAVPCLAVPTDVAVETQVQALVAAVRGNAG